MNLEIVSRKVSEQVFSESMRGRWFGKSYQVKARYGLNDRQHKSFNCPWGFKKNVGTKLTSKTNNCTHIWVILLSSREIR